MFEKFKAQAIAQGRSVYVRGAVGAATLVAGAAANATTDTSSLTAVSTDIAAVGAAVFAVIIGIKGIKWVRRAL